MKFDHCCVFNLCSFLIILARALLLDSPSRLLHTSPKTSQVQSSSFVAFRIFNVGYGGFPLSYRKWTTQRRGTKMPDGHALFIEDNICTGGLISWHDWEKNGAGTLPSGGAP